MTAIYYPSNLTKNEYTDRIVKNHKCEDFVSQCCGANRHEYVETICAQCLDHTGFECIDCNKLEEDFPVKIVKTGEWRWICKECSEYRENDPKIKIGDKCMVCTYEYKGGE